MRTALVLGVNGQDGGYLAQTLLRRGYAVTGIGRQPVSRYVSTGPSFDYVALDLSNADTLAGVVQRLRPDVAFHVAAVHGAAGSAYETVWREMMAVNVLTLHALLDHARDHQRDMRVVYAGSSKIFPAPLTGMIDETTPFRPTCLYGIGKIASLELIAYYRRQHGIAASNLVMFNHDSARRPAGFFVPAVAAAIAAALRDPSAKAELRTLDFRIDWSAADELMEFAADIAEKAPGKDFVLGSGTTWHARDAVTRMFARHGLNHRDHIVEMLPPTDPGPRFEVSLARLERAIGRRPSKTILDVVDEIVAAHAHVQTPGVS